MMVTISATELSFVHKLSTIANPTLFNPLQRKTGWVCKVCLLDICCSSVCLLAPELDKNNLRAPVWLAPAATCYLNKVTLPCRSGDPPASRCMTAALMKHDSIKDKAVRDCGSLTQSYMATTLACEVRLGSDSKGLCPRDMFVSCAVWV